MSEIWNGFKDLFIDALEILHGIFSFVGDEPAWGFAIIALTLVTRVLMLPLAVKQTRSMRAMQELQPKIKAIQKKYKSDKDMLKKDPERYKAQRQKMNEEMTALYQEAGVNPAGGCLPLVAQAPIFIALFAVLRTPVVDNPNLEPGSALDQLLHADFYVFTPGPEGLSLSASSAGVAGIVLIVLMAASMFYAQRQMMARSAATTDSAQQQQQKIMMYVMPLFLAFISYNFPMGVLLYWVTTNLWQIAQQAIVLHEVEVAAPNGRGGTGKPKSSATESGGTGSASPAGKGTGGKGTGGNGKKKPSPPASGNGRPRKARSNGADQPRKRSSDHLPRSRRRG